MIIQLCIYYDQKMYRVFDSVKLILFGTRFLVIGISSDSIANKVILRNNRWW